MTYFEEALAFVMEKEGGNRKKGGFTDDKDDAGGKTKYGISEKAHPEVDIKKLTRKQAEDIYLEKYWLGNNCHKMPHAVGFFLFDTSVNLGNGQAGEILQRVVDADVDGKIGDKTIAAAQMIEVETVLKEFYEMRVKFYEDIAEKRNNHKYLNGWLNRASDCFEEAEKLVEVE
jgi:lysozyme family protein